MKGRNKILISVLICDIVFIILLTIAGYFMYKGKTSNADKNKGQFLAKLKESDNISSEKLSDHRVDEEKKSNADKIKEQLPVKLKESDNISREKLLDHRVDEGKTSNANKIKEQFPAKKLKESNNISREKLLNHRVDEGKMSDADKIKKQFIAKLKEIDNISREKLLDYRVDEVKILSESEKQVFNEDGRYSPKDILAFVKYSVKAKDIEKTGWIAGNGEIDGEWVINKTACECLRNGKLVKSSGFSTGF
jgi:hypothetical protein